MPADGLTRTVLVIMGMRDNDCRERIAEALGAISGVRDVNVNLHRARAEITHLADCRQADLVWAVVQCGYGAALANARHDGQGASRPPAQKEKHE